MQIFIANNRGSSGDAIPLPDSTSIKPGESKTLTGRLISEAQMLNPYTVDGNAVMRLTLEAIDREPIIATPKADATPTDVDTQAGVGCQLETQGGTDVSVQPQMYVGAFDDVDCLVADAAANATLDTAAAGTIDSGAASNLLKVTPSATGEISLTLSDATDEVVYVKAWPVGTDYTIDSSGKQMVTFSTS